MTDLLTALFHAVAYAVVGGVMLVAAYYVLDLATPGHLGTHLRGVDENGNESVHAHSRSAGVVTSAWLVSNAAVLFTAIWTNGETSLGWALGWTVSFGALGILLNTVMFFAVAAGFTASSEAWMMSSSTMSVGSSRNFPLATRETSMTSSIKRAWARAFRSTIASARSSSSRAMLRTRTPGSLASTRRSASAPT